jgi:glutamine synthetase
LRTGLEDQTPAADEDKRSRLRFLPGTITDAIRLFQASDWMSTILGDSPKEKYLSYKKAVRDRNPRELGSSIKDSEVIYRHEVYNQYLWNRF